MTRIVGRVTEAKQISRSLVRIEVFDGSPRTFTAELKLNEEDFPKTAIVVLDATCARSEIVKRFEFGTIARIGLAQGQEPFLDELPGENVFLKLKVIDVSQKIGRILGILENIRPINTGKKTLGGIQGILPIEPFGELGEQLWQLKFKENGVFLYVNNTIERLPEHFGTDPSIACLLYPAIIREVLWKILIYEKFDPADEQEGWRADWIRFAKKFDPNMPSPTDDEEDHDETKDWIENVVMQFCNKFEFKQSYSKHISKHIGGENT